VLIFAIDPPVKFTLAIFVATVPISSSPFKSVAIVPMFAVSPATVVISDEIEATVVTSVAFGVNL